jgi:hypothetical protein
VPDEIRENDEGLIQQALNLLYQHFDSATIFVTRQEPGGMAAKTVAGAYGFGNWYSRYGQITEWVNNGGAMTDREESDDE